MADGVAFFAVNNFRAWIVGDVDFICEFELFTSCSQAVFGG